LNVAAATSKGTSSYAKVACVAVLKGIGMDEQAAETFVKDRSRAQLVHEELIKHVSKQNYFQLHSELSSERARLTHAQTSPNLPPPDSMNGVIPPPPATNAAGSILISISPSTQSLPTPLAPRETPPQQQQEQQHQQEHQQQQQQQQPVMRSQVVPPQQQHHEINGGGPLMDAEEKAKVNREKATKRKALSRANRKSEGAESLANEKAQAKKHKLTYHAKKLNKQEDNSTSASV
jgi:hypothetical protein